MGKNTYENCISKISEYIDSRTVYYQHAPLSWCHRIMPCRCAPGLGSWATSLRHLLFSITLLLYVTYTVSSNNSMQTIHSFILLSPSHPRNELNALHTCLTSLQTRFYTNGMALNPEKSSAILLGTAQRASSYSSLTSVDVAGTRVCSVSK